MIEKPTKLLSTPVWSEPRIKILTHGSRISAASVWCIAVMVSERLAKPSSRNAFRVRITDAPFFEH